MDFQVYLSSNADPGAIQEHLNLYMMKQALAKFAGLSYHQHVLTAPNGDEYHEAYGYAGFSYISSRLPLECPPQELFDTFLFLAYRVANGVVWIYEAREADFKEVEDYG